MKRNSFSFTLVALVFFFGMNAFAKTVTPDEAKRKAENQVRNVVEPFLAKYCADQCKLLGIEVEVSKVTENIQAPGFDDQILNQTAEWAAVTSKIKILMDEMVGPNTRAKLNELLHQHLDGLEFTSSIDAKVARFPQTAETARRIVDLRERVARQFKESLDQVVAQVCSDKCMIGELDLQTDPVNQEETQFGSSSEYVQDGNAALKIRKASATFLFDTLLTPEEQASILEMAKLKTAQFRNVELKSKVSRFPDAQKLQREIASAASNERNGKSSRNSNSETNDSKLSKTENNLNTSTNSNESTNLSKKESNELNNKQEKFERYEKIERVENGDAVQKELDKFRIFGLIFACSVISLLIFISLAIFRSKKGEDSNGVSKVISNILSDSNSKGGDSSQAPTNTQERNALLAKRYEIDRLKAELVTIFAEQPKVTKQVFSKLLSDEGIETTAAYINIFGDSMLMELLRDPSMQEEMAELTEYYAKNPFDLTDDEQLDLLKKMHNRTIASKMVLMGSRSSHLFDFMADMDTQQIVEMIRNESLTVKAVALTQCDQQKRQGVYANLDDGTRLKLLSELSRIDHLPKAYIQNVASALKRKRIDNPKLNTEALPGSEVLVNLLERASAQTQRSILKDLESGSPDSARIVKNKLVSIDTLRYLRDNHLLDVILSLKHDELLQFLKGTADGIRQVIMSKSPAELAADLNEEIEQIPSVTSETYQNVERKVLNRIRFLASDGTISLVEVNERMFSEAGSSAEVVQLNSVEMNPNGEKRAS